MSEWKPLADSFGRPVRNLRISVTDRCNIRCFYCMPNEKIRFQPRSELLTFEEIERLVRVVVRLGVTRLRITGGEPLVRSGLPRLIEKLAAVPGVADLALTTNGILLADQAAALRHAGLQRLNISLDTLREEMFERISRRRGLDRVLEGIFAAKQLGFRKIRLNAVTLRGLTEQEIVPLGRFARQHGMEVRFIEFMPLDGDGRWNSEQVLSGQEVREVLERAFGPLTPAPRTDPSQPSVDYEFADGRGRIGLINPVTAPFCGDCDRLRITAEGRLRNCLFSEVEWDVRAILREGGTDDQLADLVRRCVAAKKAGRGLDSDEFLKSSRAMFQIGG